MSRSSINSQFHSMSNKKLAGAKSIQNRECKKLQYMTKKKGASHTKKELQQQPICKCPDPYKCSCSNRPERPSPGHKWDSESQAWVGKGHRQKGGSAAGHTLKQTVLVTEKGHTKIAPHQSLPSKLLSELCRREKRPQPIFTPLAVVDEAKSGGRQFHYRCTVPDTKKNSEKDLIFIPLHACPNEEQAQEESALLALLRLTPLLPHERKLPEPYKTTWLQASAAATCGNLRKQIQTQSSSINDTANGKKDTPLTEDDGAAPAETQSKAARATKNLTAQTQYSSEAERKKQQDQQQQHQSLKLYKNEAIRVANQDHKCFMSTVMRKRIETILRGDASSSVSYNSDEEYDNDPAVNNTDEIRSYIVSSLTKKGFTPSQAQMAYLSITSTSTYQAHIGENGRNEEQLDKIHDQCLQWLCIHLNEDQLPKSFDPTGQTLDVLHHSAKQSISRSESHRQLNDASYFPELKKAFQSYGVCDEDIELILNKASATLNTERSFQSILWNALCCASGVSVRQHLEISNGDVQENRILIDEELEALSAIFSPQELLIVRNEKSQSDVSTVRLYLPNSDLVDDGTLNIFIQPQLYPIYNYPIVLLSGSWKHRECGVHINIEIIKFLFSLHLGEPMVYELHGFASNLIQNYSIIKGNLGTLPRLKPFLTKEESIIISREPKSSPDNNENRNPKNTTQLHIKPLRPRVKSDFWSKPPHLASAAVINPRIQSEISKARKQLPAADSRLEFLSILRQSEKDGNRVSVVTGATGCGKSTQLPQFILEDQPTSSKIVVTQPRRLAATGVASRVAMERGEGLPGEGSVGYAVRGEVKCNKNTRLLFCTTGVLLRHMQSESALENITHIVIDECHERNLDTDILLGLLKALLPSLPHLKVVLMSATMDAEKFSTYYGASTPRMHIPGFTHPIKDFSLEDALQWTGYIPRKGRKGVKKGVAIKFRSQSTMGDSERAEEENEVTKLDDLFVDGVGSTEKASKPTKLIPVEELVERMAEDEIDYDLIGVLIRHLIQNKEDDGSILVFLPGAPEISLAANVIRRITKELMVELLPLHGGLQPKEQNLVFKRAATGFTKVILSTNVAETSITIPDCTCVVDTCREKQSSYDPVNRMPLLVERFASADSLKQRRGRAGRIRSGAYYQLISPKAKAKLLSHGIPEICRCALDSVILLLLYIGLENGKGSFLSTLLDPPSHDSIESSLHSLIKLNAVKATSDGRVQLTPLGVHLAGIPAPPVVGKLIVMGSILGCRSAALAVAAFLSLARSPFLNIDIRQRTLPVVISETEEKSLEIKEDDKEENRRRNIIAERSKIAEVVKNSDHLLIAYIFSKWLEMESGQCRGSGKKYCETLGLSHVGMYDMKQLVSQYDSSLVSIGFVPDSSSDANSNSWPVVRCCIVAALSPGQLVRVQRPVAKYEKTSSGSLEKDTEAKEVKLYVRVSGEIPSDASCKKNESTTPFTCAVDQHDVQREEKVFFHPSSSMFGVGKFRCPWLVYHDLMRTSKPYLRGATECSAYALLLFGGNIEVQASNNLIILDDWVRLSASARIGALIGGLRQKVDDLLLAKVANPTLNITESDEIQIVIELLISDRLSG